MKKEEVKMSDVWILETEDELEASDSLNFLSGMALNHNRSAINFLRKIWDGEEWLSIKKKLETEGSDWYVWWMDGVRKFMAITKISLDQKEKAR